MRRYWSWRNSNQRYWLSIEILSMVVLGFSWGGVASPGLCLYIGPIYVEFLWGDYAR